MCVLVRFREREIFLFFYQGFVNLPVACFNDQNSLPKATQVAMEKLR